MKKKSVALLLSACMLAAMLSGCGGGDKNASSKQPKDGEDYHFNIIVQSYQSTYWQAAIAGIEEAEQRLGVKVDCTGPNSESDIADQVNMFNNAINGEPDGIAIAPCDQKSVYQSLTTAVDKEVPVICFDSGVEDAPDGSVYCTIASDNYASGELAAENLYPGLKEKIESTEGPVRVGEINQESTSESISNRGLGFIDKFGELAKKDGYKIAVIGNDFFVKKAQIENMVSEAEADIIIEVAVPAQTTVELCATEASNILNKPDTIAVFGSNQVAAEGILTADSNLSVLGNDPMTTIVAVGFDAGATIKNAVRDGKMYGAITQSPLEMGTKTVETLYKIAKGEKVKDITTACYWYDAENMDDAEIAPNLYD